MPLVFSPLTEAVLDSAPRSLHPKVAFVMRQLGEPPEIDVTMAGAVADALAARGFDSIDADGSTGSKDYLERILGLIRSTSFTIAIFSEHTRGTAMANIALELGFAAMCGKPLLIVKSPQAAAPSDLKRTDWIVYDPANLPEFQRKIDQAIDQVVELEGFEATLLGVALEARSPDCAVALERAIKGFLISGAPGFIDAAETVLVRLNTVKDDKDIDDLERLRKETRTFIEQARATLAEQEQTGP